MEIYYKHEAIRRLKNLGPAEKQKAKRKIESLLLNPLLGKLLQGEFAGLRSLKVWPLRIIYTFESKTQALIIITLDYRGTLLQSSLENTV